MYLFEIFHICSIEKKGKELSVNDSIRNTNRRDDSFETFLLSPTRSYYTKIIRLPGRNRWFDRRFAKREAYRIGIIRAGGRRGWTAKKKRRKREREGWKRDKRRKGDFVLRGVVKVTSPLSRRYGGIKQTDPLRHGLSHYSTSSIAILDKGRQRGNSIDLG